MGVTYDMLAYRPTDILPPLLDFYLDLSLHLDFMKGAHSFFLL